MSERVAWVLLLLAAGCNDIAGTNHEYEVLDNTGDGGEAAASSSVSSSATTGGSGGSDAGSIPADCGNGVIEPGEECDDQNATAGDECEACKVKCKWIENEETHHCYLTSDVLYSWESAKMNCEQNPGYYLASITSQEEKDFVAGLSGEEFWLGGINQDGWGWINGEPWKYEPWSKDNPSGDGQCLMLLGPSFGSLFNDLDCVLPHRMMCERTPAGMFP